MLRVLKHSKFYFFHSQLTKIELFFINFILMMIYSEEFYPHLFLKWKLKSWLQGHIKVLLSFSIFLFRGQKYGSLVDFTDLGCSKSLFWL